MQLNLLMKHSYWISAICLSETKKENHECTDNNQSVKCKAYPSWGLPR